MSVNESWSKYAFMSRFETKMLVPGVVSMVASAVGEASKGGTGGLVDASDKL